MPLDVPIYQPRIPISGGGGVIRTGGEENRSKLLIAQAIGEMLGNIGRGRQQKPQPELKPITGGGKTYLYNSQTGATQELKTPDGKSIAPPRSEAGRKVMDAFNDLARLSDLEDKGGLTRLEPEIIDTQKTALRQEAMGGLGLEEYEMPGEKRKRFGIDWLAKDIPPTTGVRRKSVFPEDVGVGIGVGPREGPRWPGREVESKARPPKPKEYPDAKWSEEHQMWTIVKNGRIMGVK